MKTLYLVMATLCLAGCASIDSTQVVELPTVTPFDHSPFLRTAYLEAYQDGYRAAKKGIRNPGFSRGPYPFQRELGFRAGVAAAAEERKE